MLLKGKSFFISTSAADKIGASWQKEAKKMDADLMTKMKAAVNIVYNLARTIRPKVERRKTPVRHRWSKAYRVSDPNAAFGVPVQTGLLRASIEKDVRMEKKKVVGEITAGGPTAPYAKWVEFGTSRMLPRPFIRPAAQMGKDLIKRIFRKVSIGVTINRE